MKLLPLKPKAFLKVVSTGTQKVPLDFPWLNPVGVALRGDMSDLENIKKELDEIKALVNSDISRFKMNLKDFKIIIQWAE